MEEKDWPRLFPDQFQVEVARGVVWGLQPTTHNLKMSDIDNPSCAEGYRFLVDTAKFYHENRDFLFDGEMCDPGVIECGTEEVKFLNRGTYTKKGEYKVSTHRLPTVFHSVWRDKNGKLAAVLCNWSSKKQRYHLKTSDIECEGELMPRSWKFMK